ncbi:tRNA (guanosine(46)-N7)-methyltransferase TrmB [Paenibacillus sp. N1-5-1-14]|uniref:tRNA (guanosine(46)-N7)-methyltransferase TrmB n=1 Tax=Paenibacillus radicibacter TaxID=2972488 RepID=UPI002159B07D|nr:tRNA (guanosine(46)-N7)-methyltransferase TrmB [Paenibacillus radicibacter]MCR8645636.1 tRNA (guanosine(46)-N7)-methyltransferase TrmB [Paenibacillus radicibacter]
MRLRGRKGIRENIEAQDDLVILDPAQYKGKWHEVFGNSNPIYVELGMGKGRFVSEMSRLNPDVNFIGIDMYDELIRKSSDKARAAHTTEDGNCDLSNIRLVLFNIESITDVFEDNEIQRIFLNFSDPWPKKKHARRRLTHENFVNNYAKILNDKGEIHFKTDSRSLFEFSLNSFSDLGLRMRNIALDLHVDGIHPDHVLTEYESKFIEQGVNIHRMEVMIGKEALAQHLHNLENRES